MRRKLKSMRGSSLFLFLVVGGGFAADTELPFMRRAKTRAKRLLLGQNDAARVFCIPRMYYGAIKCGDNTVGSPQESNWKTRLVEGGFPDRSFDNEFWQEQGDEAIFAAAWEMVELAEEVRHGRKPTFQRTATSLKRL